MKNGKCCCFELLIVVTLTACGNLSDISGDTIVIDKKCCNRCYRRRIQRIYYDGEELKNMAMQVLVIITVKQEVKMLHFLRLK